MRHYLPKHTPPRRRLAALFFMGSLVAAGLAFRSAGERAAGGTEGSDPPVPTAACAIALVPHTGTGPLDERIAAAQGRIRDDDAAGFTALGWLFVAQARRSYDPGFYTIAASSAECALEIDPTVDEARLLEGHVLYSLHRFAQAGTIAERLVTARQDPFDYGLLGDVALSQGRTRDAVDAYQRMVDLKPGLQSYSRAAHIRWLAGDLEAAVELMHLAAAAGSPRDPDSMAWVYAQLALYELQAGRHGPALEAADTGLSYRTDHAPALLAKGRVLLADGNVNEAIAALQEAAAHNPLPEYEWTLAEALTAGGRAEEARRIEARLRMRGAVDDPRTTSLFLATRALGAPSPGDAAAPLGAAEALELATGELLRRNDVHTRDAAAWAYLASGDVEQAVAAGAGVLSEGTRDARLYLHAGIIAARAGNAEAAATWLGRAADISQMLLPSEQLLLASERGSPGGMVSPRADSEDTSAPIERTR